MPKFGIWLDKGAGLSSENSTLCDITHCWYSCWTQGYRNNTVVIACSLSRSLVGTYCLQSKLSLVKPTNQTHRTTECLAVFRLYTFIWKNIDFNSPIRQKNWKTNIIYAFISDETELFLISVSSPSCEQISSQFLYFSSKFFFNKSHNVRLFIIQVNCESKQLEKPGNLLAGR